MSNANNGLITKIWGPPAWDFLHSVTFGYPLEPTNEQKKWYRDFFVKVGDILPCKYCRDSYKMFIKTGESKLTDESMNNRKTFTKWFYLLHNRVNEKLGVDYGVTYEDVVNKYESYRASCSKKVNKDQKGCIVPLDKKAESYKKAYMKDCPLLPYDTVKYFVKYAELRGLNDKHFKFLNKIRSTNDLSSYMSNKCCDFWCNRNSECSTIIKDMRLYGTKSLEKDGKWNGLPTVDELQLILRFSSNLSNNDLIKIIPKLPGYKKKYKLVVS